MSGTYFWHPKNINFSINEHSDVYGENQPSIDMMDDDSYCHIFLDSREQLEDLQDKIMDYLGTPWVTA
jgi:hypothetical protein